jgi:hypothetical protein
LETTVDARRALFWVDKVELESFRGEVRRNGIEAATISLLVSSLGIPELGFSDCGSTCAGGIGVGMRSLSSRLDCELNMIDGGSDKVDPEEKDLGVVMT